MTPGNRSESSAVTAILRRWREGDASAVDELLPHVYRELRRLARGQVARERQGHTLQPTALVHEAYLRLADKDCPRWQDRAHFFAVAAQLMRRVLVDHARGRAAAKRGGGAVRVTLDEGLTPQEARAVDLLDLEDALAALAKLDERKAKVVEMRFFGGMTIAETAEVLGVSEPTVVNDTRLARAWLFRKLKDEA